MLSQKLQQKLLQKLSPQQIQVIKLLEVPTMELEQRIKKEIEENPALEEGRAEAEEYSNESDNSEQDDKSKDDEFSLEDYISDDDDTPYYKLNTNNYSKDDERKEIPFSGGVSFQENLESQLGLKDINERERELAVYLIGNLDDAGYLRRDLDAVSDDLAFSMNIHASADELHKVLKKVQDLDPAGIGARDLQECLLIQLNRKERESEDIETAKKIIRNFFNEFTKKHYEKIMTRLNLDNEELKAAINEITKLNPKPGNALGDSSVKSFQQITPDFILEFTDGRFQLSLNSRNAPDLRISRTYSEMLDTYKNAENKNKSQKDAVQFVKQKLDSAKWFIEAIRQRQNTLLLTMNAILEFQKDFFVDGNEMLIKPMILKDIAEMTGLDISTISRVANSKYIQTHFGIFSLKYFFSEGLQTASGEEASSREIKTILQECIDNEDKKKPLTDDKLAQILQDKGYQIARRTVAKYREKLGIPVGRLRKEL